jgi:hypothetical protein
MVMMVFLWGGVVSGGQRNCLGVYAGEGTGDEEDTE